MTEEVLGSGSALWFSPDGKVLAYASFDDTDVSTESFVEYGNPGDLNDQYSHTHNIKYPKVRGSLLLSLFSCIIYLMPL